MTRKRIGLACGVLGVALAAAIAGCNGVLGIDAASVDPTLTDASSGDGGTANPYFTPVKHPKIIPFPTVEWPASDPLVTGVGGTYLCTDPTTGTGVDTADPPVNCQPPSNPGVREIGWIDSGGGFSHIFAKPSYQDTLPAGSTAIDAMRTAMGLDVWNKTAVVMATG